MAVYSMSGQNILLNPDMICPCQKTKKAVKDCCGITGFLYKKPANIFPSEPNTNFSKEKCYLSYTSNCCDRLTREHPISENLLEQIGKGPWGGLPWLKETETKVISPTNMNSKILCERHNNAFSDLDDMAGNFLKTLESISKDIKNFYTMKNTNLVLFSGIDLERWMLKVLAGSYFAGFSAVKKQPIKKSQNLDMNIFDKAMFGNIWLNDTAGLYIRIKQKENSLQPDLVSMPLSDVVLENVIGHQLMLLGLEIMIIINPLGVTKMGFEQEGWIHRPNELIFSAQQWQYNLVLSWGQSASGQALHIQF